MTTSLRSKNLDLIRWLNLGHENTAKKLSSITNSNYISKMATGDMEINDTIARSIESTLKLPVGWLDRDNVKLLNISTIDFNLLEVIKTRTNDSKNGLLKFIENN